LSLIDRHFIIDQTILVDSALQSVTVTNPSVSVDAKNKVVYLDVEHPPQVSVISGGGSGHEPAFTGFVGKGMLSASVTGPILSSPHADQILAALTKVDGSKGVLVVIMNHRVGLAVHFMYSFI
jgi:dihydroxyacetone kinase